MAEKTKKQSEGELPAGLNVDSYATFEVIVYAFAVVNEQRFPIQLTVTADNAKEFTALLGDFYSTLVDDESWVKYAPRPVGGAGLGAAASAQASATPAEAVEGPQCPIHKTPTTQKTARRGPNAGQSFFSCSQRNADGSYCNWRPTS